MNVKKVHYHGRDEETERQVWEAPPRTLGKIFSTRDSRDSITFPVVMKIPPRMKMDVEAEITVFTPHPIAKIILGTVWIF